MRAVVHKNPNLRWWQPHSSRSWRLNPGSHPRPPLRSHATATSANQLALLPNTSSVLPVLVLTAAPALVTAAASHRGYRGAEQSLLLSSPPTVLFPSGSLGNAWQELKCLPGLRHHGKNRQQTRPVSLPFGLWPCSFMRDPDLWKPIILGIQL